MLFRDRNEAEAALWDMGFRQLHPFLCGSLRHTLSFQSLAEVENGVGGRTKFGGTPDTPAAFEWPHIELSAESLDAAPSFRAFGPRVPLPFIAQFDLNELGPQLDGAWPVEGMLWLFGMGAWEANVSTTTRRGAFRALHVRQPGVLRPVVPTNAMARAFQTVENELGSVRFDYNHAFPLQPFYASSATTWVQLMPPYGLRGWFVPQDDYLAKENEDLLASMFLTSAGGGLLDELKMWCELPDPDWDEARDEREDEAGLRLGGYPAGEHQFIQMDLAKERRLAAQHAMLADMSPKEMEAWVLSDLDRFGREQREEVRQELEYVHAHELILQAPQTTGVNFTGWGTRETIRSGRFHDIQSFSYHTL